MLKYLYKKWLLQSKNLMVVVLLVFVDKIVIQKQLAVVAATSQPFCIFESGIMMMNSGLILMLISLFFIMIMSDYPSADTNIYYQIIRSGRRVWFRSQVKFAFLAIGTYLGVLLAYVAFRSQQYSFLANGWSINISDYSEEYMLTAYIPMQLFNQMPPIQAYIWSLVLLFLYFFFLLGFQIVGFTYGKKQLTGTIQLLIVIIGMCLVFFKSRLMWLLPQAHSILWLHYDKYYRKMSFSVYASAIIFFVGGVVLFCLAYRRILTINIDTIRDQE